MFRGGSLSAGEALENIRRHWPEEASLASEEMNRNGTPFTLGGSAVSG